MLIWRHFAPAVESVTCASPRFLAELVVIEAVVEAVEVTVAAAAASAATVETGRGGVSLSDVTVWLS